MMKTIGIMTIGTISVKTNKTKYIMNSETNKNRPIYEIANEIRSCWRNVYFGAEPYLSAMASINSINDMYYADTARSVVMYFLSNATKWRGEDAKRIKTELNNMLK
jgi:hypothetical protein